jgi:hypothetical protein
MGITDRFRPLNVLRAINFVFLQEPDVSLNRFPQVKFVPPGFENDSVLAELTNSRRGQIKQPA